MDTLQRFVIAQDQYYEQALGEIHAGKKSSHWMWFIFPQLRGLGRSETATYYGLTGIAEARAYLNHPILGRRLKEITRALLDTGLTDAHTVMGYPDDLKLKSSMTLFAAVAKQPGLFESVLKQFFGGTRDQCTLDLLALAE